MLERVWGEGWLSPGGPAEVAQLLKGMDISGKSVLDIGCGAGGVDLALVGSHGAGFVTGLDVEETVLAHYKPATDQGPDTDLGEGEKEKAASNLEA